MSNDLTREQTARLLTWVGIDATPRCKWCGWSKASCNEKAICLLTNGGIHCVEPMPALTGDYGKARAMDCLEKLGTETHFDLSRHNTGWTLSCDVPSDSPTAMLAIFRALLAYLDAQEQPHD